MAIQGNIRPDAMTKPHWESRPHSLVPSKSIEARMFPVRVCGGPLPVVSCLSQPHSAYSVIFLLKDESSILFQNWLDPSKEIKKQIRSEYLLMAGVCGWVGRAWL